MYGEQRAKERKAGATAQVSQSFVKASGETWSQSQPSQEPHVSQEWALLSTPATLNHGPGEAPGQHGLGAKDSRARSWGRLSITYPLPALGDLRGPFSWPPQYS